MREIIFRGFHPDENRSKTITLNGEKICGKWVEGGFCYEYNRGVPLICPRYDFSQEVIPETVGQYTGLTDKNGNKIFEGDIVKDIDGRIYEIKDFDFEWIAEQTKSFWINIKHLKPCDVIGNKWEAEE